MEFTGTANPSLTWRTDLLGQTLQTKDKGIIVTHDNKVLLPETKTIVGLYFSALWCPPCEQFLKDLIIFYANLKESHPHFEIVFISSDKDERQFKQCKEMPNHACIVPV